MPGPFVSVVMPVRNEERRVAAALQAVVDQDYPPDRMEVLVADGRSTDCTRDIVRALAAQAHADGRASVGVVDNPGEIVPTGMNAALRRARGEIVVRVDGHCRIAPDYVRRCVEALGATGASCVGGRQDAVAVTAVGRAVALATSSPFGVGNARFHYATEPGWVDTVYLGAWPKSVLEEAGGFDEEMVRNQDDELSFRLVQKGGKIWFDPSIRSEYHPRESFAALWRQYHEYGIFKVLVIRKRGGVASWRHLVPAAFVSALSASALITATRRRAWPLMAVAGPYLVANLAASWRSSGGKARESALVSVATATMHVSYGSGFLRGLIRWRGR